MIDPGARCATHVSVPAADLCARCGSYVCSSCMELEDFETYCFDCYQKVGRNAPNSSRATMALVMGILAISGCLPLAFPAMILGHMELAAIEAGESPPGGRNLAQGAVYIGYVVTGLSVAFGLLMVLLFAASMG